MIKHLFSNNPSPAPVEFTAFISSSNLDIEVPNGSYTTPFFTGSAIGGTPPYSYLWSIDKGSVNQPNATKTNCTVSGFFEEVDAILTLTVTDDNENTTTAQTAFLIQFGTPR